MSATDLRRLERLKAVYKKGAASDKLAVLKRLSRARLGSAAQVERLHAVLCFLRAYPDDYRVLAQVSRMLDRFERRGDLIQHREQLADTGIAGTATHYRFFWSTALWLARHWPGELTFDRDDDEAAGRLRAALPLLVPASAAEWLAAAKPQPFAAIDRLRGRSGDAAWFVERVTRLAGDSFTREAFADAIDMPYVLQAGRDTPARTRALFPPAPRAFQEQPLQRGRPDLRKAIAIPPRGVSQLSRREGTALIDLARSAMVSRARDLATFEYGDARDVRLVDDGEGLAFAFCGMLPERRSTLPALYGCLTLKNGVPIGYVQADVLGPWAAISYNTFETFRGGEAAHVFGRLLAAVHHLFGAESFSIEPYQLGQGNDEGIETGAWWFYQKLGFRPRTTAARRLMRAELARMKKHLGHRSSASTLAKLAESYLFFDLHRGAEGGLPPIQAALERAVQWLARHGGGAEAQADAERAALGVTGLKSLAGFSRDERIAWQRWAPLIASLPGVSRWRPAERRELAEIARAKGGPTELAYLVRFAAHAKLRRALLGA